MSTKCKKIAPETVLDESAGTLITDVEEGVRSRRAHSQREGSTKTRRAFLFRFLTRTVGIKASFYSRVPTQRCM